MSLLVKKAIKECALRCSEERAHTFTRVADSFVDDIEADVLLIIKRRVRALPSKGKTIK